VWNDGSVVSSPVSAIRDHRRHDLEQIADDAVIGDFEDRRIASLLMATIVRAPFMPTTCWMAPEMPSAT
jgi:hypothetical protein